MTAVVRWFGSLAAAACLAAAAVLPAAAQPPPPPPPIPVVISTLGSPSNTDAFVSPNTFVVMSDQTRDLAIGVNVPLSMGAVDVTVTCCTNPITGQPISVNTANPTVSIAPFHLVGGGVHSATLTVKAFNVPTIAFLATIHVDNAARRFHAAGSILVNVVRVPVDTTVCSGAITPGSGATAEVLPLNEVITSMFIAKQATPSLTSFEIGAATKDSLHGWKMTIESGGTLAPTTSTVVFKNSTHLEKRIVPFATSSCMPSVLGANFIVASGGAMTIPISGPPTATLVLQRKVCRFAILACFSYGFDDIAVFSVPPFWTLFGGRKVTIDWISGGADL